MIVASFVDDVGTSNSLSEVRSYNSHHHKLIGQINVL